MVPSAGRTARPKWVHPPGKKLSYFSLRSFFSIQVSLYQHIATCFSLIYVGLTYQHLRSQKPCLFYQWLGIDTQDSVLSHYDSRLIKPAGQGADTVFFLILSRSTYSIVPKHNFGSSSDAGSWEYPPAAEFRMSKHVIHHNAEYLLSWIWSQSTGSSLSQGDTAEIAVTRTVKSICDSPSSILTSLNILYRVYRGDNKDTNPRTAIPNFKVKLL